MHFTTFLTLFAASLAAAMPAPEVDAAAKNGDSIVKAAEKELGKPYVFGGGDCKGPTGGGFDCSGLTQYAVCQSLHKTIPRTAQEQYDSHMGKKIARKDAQAGDLIFWAEGGDCSRDITHVGIVMGNLKKNYMVNAATPGTLVREQEIWTDADGLDICGDAVRFW